MLCHIIVSVVHEPSHKWKESLFCGGFWPFWLGCPSLWHRHAGAGFKNDNFFKGQKNLILVKYFNCVSEENCRSKCKLSSKLWFEDEKIQVDPEQFKTQIRHKSGANPAPTEAMEDGDRPLQRRLHFREDWLCRTFSIGKWIVNVFIQRRLVGLLWRMFRWFWEQRTVT